MDPGNRSGNEAVTWHLSCMSLKTAAADTGGRISVGERMKKRCR